MKNRNVAIVFSLAVFAFFYFLFFSRFDIIAADEGYFNLACFRIINGELPYRDFFLHTPPISYYFQTLIFRIFGQDLIVGRITTVFIGAIIAVLLFAISSRLSRPLFSIIPSLIFIFFGVSHIPYPSFNWYGLLVALLIVLGIFKFIESDKRHYIIALGFFAALLSFIKQNLGIAAFISILLYLLIYRIFTNSKFTRNSVKEVAFDYLFISTGAILTIFPIVLFFFKNGILRDALYYLFKFSYESLLMRMEPIPFPHLKLASFLILGIYLFLGYAVYKVAINKRYVISSIMLITVISLIVLSYIFGDSTYINDHIKEGILNGFFNLPALFILLTAFLLIRKVIKQRTIEKMGLYLGFLALFSFFYIWFSLIITRDLIHLIPTMPISYPFIGFYLNRLYDRYTTKFASTKISKTYFFIIPVLFFLGFGLYINLVNETFSGSSTSLTQMHYGMKLNRAKYLIVEREKGTNIENLVNYIISNTKAEEKIFLYQIDSSLYILADRMPGTFHTLFIPNAFQPRDQQRVMEDLIKNDVKLVALPEYVVGKNWLTRSIEHFLFENYIIEGSIGPYYILLKR